MSRNNHVFSIVLVFLLLSCNKETAPDFVKSRGETMQETRNLQPFKKLLILDEFDIEIIQDSIHFITLKTGKNLLPKVNSQIEKGTLTLSNDNTFNWLRKLGERVQVQLHVTKLDEIEIEGDARVFNTDTFFADTLNFKHSGTNDINMLLKSQWATFRCANVGNLTLKGACGILSGTVEETAIFDGKDFLAEDAYFYHFSLANSYVRARQLYGLNLYGKGDLFYMQTPLRKFTKLETGTGRVKLFN